VSHDEVSTNPDDWPDQLKTGDCADCLASRRRAALIGMGMGVALAASVGLLLLPFVAKR